MRMGVSSGKGREEMVEGGNVRKTGRIEGHLRDGMKT